MELLDNFSFVKIKPITNEKALLSEIREAVDTLNLVKKGKIQARPAKELLSEIWSSYYTAIWQADETLGKEISFN